MFVPDAPCCLTRLSVSAYHAPAPLRFSIDASARLTNSILSRRSAAASISMLSAAARSNLIPPHPDATSTLLTTSILGSTPPGSPMHRVQRNAPAVPDCRHITTNNTIDQQYRHVQCSVSVLAECISTSFPSTSNQRHDAILLSRR